MIADESDAALAALTNDPLNLAKAWAYLRARGDACSGRDIALAFRVAALATSEGVTAFARAFKELNESTGELPHPPWTDAALFARVEAALMSSAPDEREILQWFLTAANHPPDNDE